MTNLDAYESRYGTDTIRSIWSEKSKRERWRRVWYLLLQAMVSMGFIKLPKPLRYTGDYTLMDYNLAKTEEDRVGHDVVAELNATATTVSQMSGNTSPEAYLHLGLTSSDIVDNADAKAVRASVQQIVIALETLLRSLIEFVREHAGQPVVGYTHWQKALPTTLGFRFAVYLSNFMEDYRTLEQIALDYPQKGIRGAVGTAAAIREVIWQAYMVENGKALFDLEAEFDNLEDRVMLGEPTNFVTGQTAPRRNDYEVLAALAGMCATLHKMAQDIRFMQSVGQLGESNADEQVGSSAMAHKRNPILSERICSLSRRVAGMVRDAWDHAALSGMERTLDDSAARRDLLPQAFLLSSQCLVDAIRVVQSLQVYSVTNVVEVNKLWKEVASERILTIACMRGAHRQSLHRFLQDTNKVNYTPRMWAEVVASHGPVRSGLTFEEVQAIVESEPSNYVGFAPMWAQREAQRVEHLLDKLVENARW
jgi:adenylosuccinate lyase